MKTVQKPWGGEIIWAETARYAGKILIIEPGHRLSRQYHEKKDESIYVVSGPLRLEIGSKENFEVINLEVGKSYHIEPGKIHRFCAEDNSVVLFEVSTPELNDVIRLEDDYSRND